MLYVNPTFGRYVEVAAGQPMEEAESDALLQDRMSGRRPYPRYTYTGWVRTLPL